MQARKDLAPHAGVFRGAQIRAPLKTPAWEARKDLNESSYNWINFSPVFPCMQDTQKTERASQTFNFENLLFLLLT